ncbi:MAG: ABC transporter substrate binding protein [Chloroflexi bacterium]|nr:ABC transporter substrate binding protein [Chloroflexota bacterium]
MKNAVLFIIAMSLLFTGTSIAQNDDKPTVAFLKWGDLNTVALAEKGVLDMLQAYGFINEEERALISQEKSFNGEKINIIYGDALFDRAQANVIIEEAIDQDADVLVTFTTALTQIAAYAIADFSDPPALIFSLVSGPYITKIADASCVKPDHVTGTRPVTNYEDIVPLVLMQDPNMKVVGTIYSPDQRASEVGAGRIKQIGESLGLTVEVDSIMAAPDLYHAVESLVDRGAEAIIIPIFTFSGFPLLMTLSYDYGIPVFFSAPPVAYRGGTVGGGFYGIYGQGVIAGRMLTGHLNGDIDIAEIGIFESDDFGYAVNLDTADLQGVEISQMLLDGAEFVVENGETAQGVIAQYPEVNITLPDMTLEERRAADLAFLAGLECTAEMIAEQQAALAASQ